jgi:hypothetical protein
MQVVTLAPANPPIAATACEAKGASNAAGSHPPPGRAGPKGQRKMMRPWTDDEMHRLRVLAKEKVSTYYIAKSLGRSAGSMKLKARSLGLILYKKAKAKGE